MDAGQEPPGVRKGGPMPFEEDGLLRSRKVGRDREYDLKGAVHPLQRLPPAIGLLKAELTAKRHVLELLEQGGQPRPGIVAADDGAQPRHVVVPITVLIRSDSMRGKAGGDEERRAPGSHDFGP